MAARRVVGGRGREHLNTRWSPAEAGFALTESRTGVLFADDAFAETAAGLPGVRMLVYCGDGPAPYGMAAYEDLVAGAAPAGVFDTGGTTGEPRGVVLSHANLMTPALGGGHVVLPSFDPVAMAAAIDRHGVTATGLVVGDDRAAGLP